MNRATTSRAPQSLRCFLALWPDSTSVAALARCREDALRAGAAPGVRWIEPVALHLTLRFLGRTRAAQRERLENALTDLAMPLPAVLAKCHAFWPSHARPRLLVLELARSPHLTALASKCEDAACNVGFPPETRAFRPHVTLARLRPGCALDPPLAPPDTIVFQSLALVASDLGASGARYRTLAGVALPRVTG